MAAPLLLILAGGLIFKNRAKLFPASKENNSASTQIEELKSNLTELSVTIESEKEILDRNFKIVSGTLCFSVTSALFFQSLSPLAGIGLAFIVFPNFRRAINSLQKGKVDVHLIDSIVIPAMFFSKFYVLSSFSCWIYCLAQQLVYKTKDHSKKQLISIFSDLPDSVWILQNGSEILLESKYLKSGDVIIVSAGEKIAVDGIIIDGLALVDQHILTGESLPVEKNKDDNVFASTLVLSGKLKIRVTLSGQETVAAQIANLLNNTADFKLGIQTHGEEVADKAALPTIILSCLALPIVGKNGATSVLASFIGSDIRIFAPITILNFLRIASDNSILIKDGRALEKISQINTIVFDKTGTLTEEQPSIGKIYTFNHYTEGDVLRYAATAEYKQTHPIAKAILEAAKQRNLIVTEIDNANYELGYGITVHIGADVICVGSLRFMHMVGVDLPKEVSNISNDATEQGYSLISVSFNNQLVGIVELQATLRPEIKTLIANLRARNLTTYIISGDSEQPTRQLATEIGVEHYFSEVLPKDKANLIEKLQIEGKIVCFVGDGINDSIALKKADVSISLGSGASIAKDTAQILLINEDLKNLEFLFELGNELKSNLNTSLVMAIIPGVAVVSGVFLLHTGILAAIVVNNLAMLAGIGNAMRPLLNHPKKKI